ncbi:branchpoint-bridging protein isoform X2 [Tripterygium wilfordii]|uniref:branchpoint-bridging protein isoform X2 n=1 Tax=Tripterygium wilfordii TaxID=458696 RepID=UPI0018F7EEFE|nr:branchpoint-bridging protein isoform X2 [Tripterygium wilfordii]
MAATSSAAPTSGPKISMFSAKAGFVIPRNKLSGALVPTIRGGKKSRDNDAADGESSNQVQRKTKWGPDLTEDASVRRGRALAYQTRVDQITQQLKSGTLEVGDVQDSSFDALLAKVESSSPQIDNEMSELLNIEKREVISEILKLNPSYRAPADYKPVLKEARVPIPVKDYPGYNFLGLIFGPGSGTHKRLEKETGAKIKVFGTKESSGEKVEIFPSDGNDFQTDYEELYILVSAETFERVDAAVSLIEMLVTSVSGNLAAVSVSASLPVDNATQGQDSATHPTVINQAVVHPVVPLAPTPSQGQLLFSGPSQIPLQFSSGLYSPQDFSAPIRSNPVNMQPSPFNPSAMPSLFGPGPAPAIGYYSVLQNQHPSTQVLTNAYMPRTNPLNHNLPPRNFSMPAPQPSSAQSNISAPLSFSQPGSGIPPRPLPDQPLDLGGSSSGWSRNPMSIQPSLGPNSSGQFTPLIIPPQRPRPANPQPVFPSMVPPSNTSGSHMVMPVSFPSGSPAPQSSLFNSVPTSQVGSSHPTPVGLPVVPMAPSPSPSMNSAFGSTPILPPMPSPPMAATLQAKSAANFTPIRPIMTQHPSSGDFTFQPHRTPNLASQMGPRPGGHPATPDSPSPRPMVQSPGPQAPPFRFSQPVMQSFVRPQIGNQMGQAMASVMHRPPAYQGPQMGMGNFTTAHQRHLAGPIPPRPGNHLQLQQNYPTSVTPRENSVASSQRFNCNFPVAPGNPAPLGGQQVYDPFSPTSVAVPAHQQGGNDPESKI